MDIKELEWEGLDRIYVAGERDKGQAIANAAVKFLAL